MKKVAIVPTMMLVFTAFASTALATMLDRNIDFPYRIRNIPMSDTQLTKSAPPVGRVVLIF